MNKFNLTTDRLKVITKRLKEQDTISNIAYDLGVSRQVLGEKLNELGMSHKAIKNGGLLGMKRAMFRTIENIEDEAKRVEAMGRFLDRYPVALEDDESTNTSSGIVDIRLQIMSDLEQQ